MSLSNYPPGALYDDAAPWNSADAAGSCIERSERNEFIDYRTKAEKAEDARFWASIALIQADRRAA